MHGETEPVALLRETVVRSRIFRRALAGSLVAFTFAIYSIAGDQKPVDWLGIVLPIVPLPLLLLLAVEGFFNQPYRWLLERFKDRLLQVLYVQITIDIIVITAFLHYAGGIEALLLNTAYFLPIVFGGVLVSAQVSLYTAMLSSVAYGGLILGEYFGWIPHVPTFGIQMNFMQQILFVCISVFFFNFSGYFTTYPSRILRDHRRALAQATEELEKWNDRLAQRVREKTAELKQTYDKLVESEKLAVLGQFAAGLTHEIDNPLTIISGRAESLLIKGGLDPKMEQTLQTILNQAQRAAEMTSQLLSISRPTAVELAPLQLNTLIEETLGNAGFRPEFAKVKIVKELAKNLPVIQGDRKRLIEVFSNLFNNAAQAMPGGGSLRVCTMTSNHQVITEIYDTGTGIAPENIPKLFTPFFTTKDIGKGTGLGLFVCNGIIRKHGGTITVFSEVGKGTCFTVTLPVRPAEVTLPPEPKTAQHTEVQRS